MRRRRQQKLEKKLQQFRSRDGGPDTGGTLKVGGTAPAGGGGGGGHTGTCSNATCMLMCAETVGIGGGGSSSGIVHDLTCLRGRYTARVCAVTCRTRRCCSPSRTAPPPWSWRCCRSTGSTARTRPTTASYRSVPPVHQYQDTGTSTPVPVPALPPGCRSYRCAGV